MARPLKQGLDYFPLDVGFLQDMKVRRIIKSCGASAISVLIWLLGSCYRDEGYYIWWTEDLPFIVADEIGVTEGCVQEVVKRALQVGFFDAGMKEKHGILTSAGIQKRFLEVTSRRKAAFLRRDFALVSINVDNNSINVCNNSINVYSNEQSKVKKSKVKNINTLSSNLDGGQQKATDEIIFYLNKKTGQHYKVKTPKTVRLIRARLKEGFTVEDFKAVIEKKCDDWLGNEKMERYLRPETLFGTKFEGYLNETPNNEKDYDIPEFEDLIDNYERRRSGYGNSE